MVGKVVYKNEDEPFVCSECGEPLEAVKEEDPTDGNGGGEGPNKPNKKLIILIAAVVVIIGGIVAAVMGISNKRAEEAEQQRIADSIARAEAEAAAQAEADSIAALEQAAALEQQRIADSIRVADSLAAAKAKKGGSSRVSLGYASYDGGSQGGQPHGNGTMTFRQSHLIPGTADCQAQPGEKVIGTWRDGKINMGTWYRNDGSQAVVKLGQRYNR